MYILERVQRQDTSNQYNLSIHSYQSGIFKGTPRRGDLGFTSVVPSSIHSPPV